MVSDLIPCFYFSVSNTANSPFGFYQCDTFGLNISSPLKVDGATGTHELGKTDFDVTRFNVDSQTLFYIPKELSKIFPNLIAIRVYNSGLKSLSLVDFQPFPNMVEFDFPANEIETLPVDLFSATTQIYYIALQNNNISRVGLDVLAPMSSLRVAYFGGNFCTQFNANNAAEVVALQADLNNNCL